MSEEKIRVRCPACHVEFQLEDEPKVLYAIPVHKGPIMNPCTGSGLTTAYHAHGVPGYGNVVVQLGVEAPIVSIVAATATATSDVPVLSIQRATKRRLEETPRAVT